MNMCTLERTSAPAVASCRSKKDYKKEIFLKIGQIWLRFNMVQLKLKVFLKIHVTKEMSRKFRENSPTFSFSIPIANPFFLSLFSSQIDKYIWKIFKSDLCGTFRSQHHLELDCRVTFHFVNLISFLLSKKFNLSTKPIRDLHTKNQNLS